MSGAWKEADREMAKSLSCQIFQKPIDIDSLMTQSNNIENLTMETEAPLEGNYFVSAYPPFSCWKKESAKDVEKLLNESNYLQEEAPLGLYVHIPFCTVRCHYCYYLSFTQSTDERMEKYVDALIREAALYAEFNAIANRPLTFAYFGGGTPSILSADQIGKLMHSLKKSFAWQGIEEVTFECSPKTITKEKLQTLRDAGVTRLSMGVQQLDDEVLRQNGRVHLVSDVERVYEMIQQVGFDVVNLDLIVGLAGETNTSFMQSLEQLIDMNPESITIYQLEIPKNTPLYHLYHNEKLENSPAPWQLKRIRLNRGFTRLGRSGYQLRSAYTATRTSAGKRFAYQDVQYHGADLMGIGVSSFSYFHGAHYQNLTSLKSYLEQVQAGRLPIERAYFLSREEQLVRELVLQLKLGSVTRGYFQEKFNTDIFERFSEPIANFEARDLLYTNGEKLSLTREGLLQVDHMLLAFYLPEHQGLRYS